VHEGVVRTAFDILLEETDPRYVVAEIDVFWAADAFEDPTGVQVAALINQWASRIQLLHLKDGINIADPANGSPRAIGAGELDFVPILATAKGRVRYYHQEHEGGTLTDADVSLTNLKGINTAVVPTLLGTTPVFQPVRPGLTSPVESVIVENTGDAPLSITNVAVAAHALDAPAASDFRIVGQNCTIAVRGAPLWPRSLCTVNVVFEPDRQNTTSVARVQFTSDSDDAADTALLVATSLNTIPVVTAPAGQKAVPGVQKLFALGSFADPGAPGPWNVDVDWGDGSAHTVFVAFAAGPLVQAAHAYAAPGTYPVTVELTDDEGESGDATFQVKAAHECVVPKLVRKTLAAARTALLAAHCRLGVVTKAFSNTIPKGRVTKQRRAPGLHLPNGTKVGVTLSKGRRPR
jgi:hypothetical protein